MEKSEYILFFYSIVAGLTATSYLTKWGEVIVNRKEIKNWLVNILWSAGFFLSIINEWFVQFSQWETRTNTFDLLRPLVFPFGLYIISVLLFPKISNKKVNLYNHFRKHCRIILGTMIALSILKYDFDKGIIYFNNTNIALIIIIIACTIPIFSSKKYVNLIAAGAFLTVWIHRMILMSA